MNIRFISSINFGSLRLRNNLKMKSWLKKFGMIIVFLIQRRETAGGSSSEHLTSEIYFEIVRQSNAVVLSCYQSVYNRIGNNSQQSTILKIL